MSGHQGGDTSTLSKRKLYLLSQLRSGKTAKGKDIDKIEGKREELEKEVEVIVEKMKAEKEARHDERMETIMNHTTKVANDTAETIKKALAEQPLNALVIQPGNPKERIIARQNEIKILQAANASDKVEQKRATAEAAAQKRDAAQKKADAKAAREQTKKDAKKTKRKDLDVLSVDQETSSTVAPTDDAAESVDDENSTDTTPETVTASDGEDGTKYYHGPHGMFTD